MLTYKAAYRFFNDGVHVELLDFPEVVTCGVDLEEARRMVSDALVDMADTRLSNGEPLPQPDPSRHDHDADLEEPVHLILSASTRVSVQARPSS